MLHALFGVHGGPGAAAEGQADVKDPARVRHLRSAGGGRRELVRRLFLRLEHQQEPLEPLDKRKRPERQYRHLGNRVG